jgi:hypothetical protein
VADVERIPTYDYAPDADVAKYTRWNALCAGGACRYRDESKVHPVPVDPTQSCPGWRGVVHLGETRVLRVRPCDRHRKWHHEQHQKTTVTRGGRKTPHDWEDV